jgi:site-specific recombinase XerC
VLATNPAHAVRGPKHVVQLGKTPVPTTDQARALIESIDASTLVGLHERALIGVMTYAFARIGAVVSMRVEDYFVNGKRWWVRLHEKGGKRHEMPAQHKLEAFLEEYIKAASIGEDGKNPSVPLGDRPYRRTVSSRETHRWMIPKGWPMKGRKPTEAATREAYEELPVPMFGSLRFADQNIERGVFARFAGRLLRTEPPVCC